MDSRTGAPDTPTADLTAGSTVHVRFRTQGGPVEADLVILAADENPDGTRWISAVVANDHPASRPVPPMAGADGRPRPDHAQRVHYGIDHSAHH